MGIKILNVKIRLKCEVTFANCAVRMRHFRLSTFNVNATVWFWVLFVQCAHSSALNVRRGYEFLRFVRLAFNESCISCSFPFAIALYPIPPAGLHSRKKKRRRKKERKTHRRRLGGQVAAFVKLMKGFHARTPDRFLRKNIESQSPFVPYCFPLVLDASGPFFPSLSLSRSLLSCSST